MGFCPELMALFATAFGAEHCGGVDDHCGGDWKLGAPHVTLFLGCQAPLLLAVANGLGC